MSLGAAGYMTRFSKDFLKPSMPLMPQAYFTVIVLGFAINQPYISGECFAEVRVDKGQELHVRTSALKNCLCL